MKYLPVFSWCLLALSFVPSRASADDPSPVERARRQVEVGLLEPLAARESKRRFSRERPPPHERRVRVTDSALVRDAHGREFLPFAVDIRYAADWQANDIVGCAYPENGKLFVKRGDAYFPAALMLGKETEPVAGVCRVPARS